MTFDGHEMIKITESWLLDLTTFICYKVKTNKEGKLIDATKAFKVTDELKNSEFKYQYFIDRVPVGILRKTEKTIQKYYKEALVND